MKQLCNTLKENFGFKKESLVKIGVKLTGMWHSEDVKDYGESYDEYASTELKEESGLDMKEKILELFKLYYAK